MAEFYSNLWEKKQPPVDALRAAQVAMLARYRLKNGSLLRAGVEEQPFDEKSLAALRGKLQAGEELLPPFYWAGFVLSGAGR